MTRPHPPRATIPVGSSSPADAHVVAVREVSTGVRHLFIEPSLAGRFVAGQVAELGIPGRAPGIFAIASSPCEAGPAMFVIKDNGKASTDLFSASPGDRVTLRAPFGPGFDLEGLGGRDVLFVGVGTALAPLRSALVTLLTTAADGLAKSHEPFRSLSMVYGIRRPTDACFVGEHARWRAAGVHVRLVASRPDPGDRWSGRVGRPQDHLADLVTPRTTALLAGMDAMVTEVGARLRALGLAAGDLRTNT